MGFLEGGLSWKALRRSLDLGKAAHPNKSSLHKQFRQALSARFKGKFIRGDSLYKLVPKIFEQIVLLFGWVFFGWVVSPRLESGTKKIGNGKVQTNKQV